MSDTASTLLAEAREFVESQRAYFHSPKAWACSRSGMLLGKIDSVLVPETSPTTTGLVVVVDESAAVEEVVGDEG